MSSFFDEIFSSVLPEYQELYNLEEYFSPSYASENVYYNSIYFHRSSNDQETQKDYNTFQKEDLLPYYFDYLNSNCEKRISELEDKLKFYGLVYAILFSIVVVGALLAFTVWIFSQLEIDQVNEELENSNFETRIPLSKPTDDNIDCQKCQKKEIFNKNVISEQINTSTWDISNNILEKAFFWKFNLSDKTTLISTSENFRVDTPEYNSLLEIYASSDLETSNSTGKVGSIDGLAMDYCYNEVTGFAERCYDSSISDGFQESIGNIDESLDDILADKTQLSEIQHIKIEDENLDQDMTANITFISGITESQNAMPITILQETYAKNSALIEPKSGIDPPAHTRDLFENDYQEPNQPSGSCDLYHSSRSNDMPISNELAELRGIHSGDNFSQRSLFQLKETKEDTYQESVNMKNYLFTYLDSYLDNIYGNFSEFESKYERLFENHELSEMEPDFCLFEFHDDDQDEKLKKDIQIIRTFLLTENYFRDVLNKVLDNYQNICEFIESKSLAVDTKMEMYYLCVDIISFENDVILTSDVFLGIIYSMIRNLSSLYYADNVEYRDGFRCLYIILTYIKKDEFMDEIFDKLYFGINFETITVKSILLEIMKLLLVNWIVELNSIGEIVKFYDLASQKFIRMISNFKDVEDKKFREFLIVWEKVKELKEKENKMNNQENIIRRSNSIKSFKRKLSAYSRNGNEIKRVKILENTTNKHDNR